MAKQHGVPVFANVADAVRHAIDLVKQSERLTLNRLHEILANVKFLDAAFAVEEISNGFLLQMSRIELDTSSGAPSAFTGRKWFIDPSASASAVVRTAFLAALTWQEHEARHHFTYKGTAVFGPHSDVERLARLTGSEG